MKFIFTLLLFFPLFFTGSAQNSVSAKGKTFSVADVKEANLLLADTNFKLVLENYLSEKIICLPQETDNAKVVSMYVNGFLQAIHDCYDDHRPLVISPDDIWLLLCQGLAIHINTLPDSDRNKILRSHETETLCVRIDSLITNKCDYWKTYIDTISEKIKKDTHLDMYNLIVQNYSTTTPLIQTVYKATLLETFKKAYNYLAMSGCGIPRITLTGTKEDWDKIYTNVDQFKKYGLNDWVENIKPILKEFCNAYAGNVDKEFWNKMYKTSQVYATTFISGWIIKFFPYVKSYQIERDSTVPLGMYNYKYIPNKYLEADDYVFSKLTTREFPSGYTRTPITWINYFNSSNGEPDTIPIVLYAGFLGVEQSSDKSLSPLISWAISQDSITYDYFYLRYVVDTGIVHKNTQWSSEIVDRAEVMPVYAPDSNISFSEGITFLLQYLKDSLSKEEINQNYKPADIWVDFIVTWEGNVRDVEVSENCSNEIFSAKLKSLLLNLPYKWSPAQSDDDSFFFYRTGLKFANYKLHLKVL